MRAGKIDRVKRQLLREAVAENLDTMRGLPPRPLSVRRVVIDAGHGGTDPGATLPPDLSEKAVTLDIATRLRKLLQQSGFEVITTRADDRLIPLRERARIANASASDIFISIHVNSIVDHRTSTASRPTTSARRAIRS
jgi:N-acetylmuramoyl-L-alanine amidase